MAETSSLEEIDTKLKAQVSKDTANCEQDMDVTEREHTSKDTGSSEQDVNAEENEQISNDAEVTVSSGQDSDAKEKERISNDTASSEGKWTLVNSNKNLRKRIKKRGNGSKTKPQILETVNISYKLFLSNGEQVEDKNTEIHSRDCDIIEGLDFAISEMEEGEIAELEIPANLAYGTFGRSPDIPPNSDLNCYVEVHKVYETPEEDSLSFEERLKLGHQKKLNGNFWYARKKFISAIHSYRRALDILDTNVSSLDAPEDELQTMLEERVVVYNNLAAAQLQISAFDAVLKSVDNVLKFKPRNAKALYRKSKAYQGKGMSEECIKFLRQAVKLAPESSELQHDLANLVNKKRLSDNKEKEMYKKMFGLEDSTKEDSSRKVYWSIAIGTVIVAAIGYFTAHHFTTVHV